MSLCCAAGQAQQWAGAQQYWAGAQHMAGMPQHLAGMPPGVPPEVRQTHRLLARVSCAVRPCRCAYSMTVSHVRQKCLGAVDACSLPMRLHASGVYAS